MFENLKWCLFGTELLKLTISGKRTNISDEAVFHILKCISQSDEVSGSEYAMS